ncbi:MAG: helix-turn-helix domain-containing protein [Kineosporiaceae bacterium]
MAALAGVSVEYLTRLEQGRDANPSVQVLAALAAALRLDDADRDHLHDLAIVCRGTGLSHRPPWPAAHTVRPAVRAVLDRLDPTPAYVVNHRADLLAWNRGFDGVARPLGLLSEPGPNLLVFVMTAAGARDALPRWGEVADRLVGYLHAMRRGDPATDELAARLAATAGEDFVRRWSRRPLPGGGSGPVIVVHPEAGLLRLVPEELDLGDAAFQRLVVLLPQDPATEAALARTASGDRAPEQRGTTMITDP